MESEGGEGKPESNQVSQNPKWGISSAGRAPALHAGGQRFDSAILHQKEANFIYEAGLFFLI